MRGRGGGGGGGGGGAVREEVVIEGLSVRERMQGFGRPGCPMIRSGDMNHTSVFVCVGCTLESTM